MTQRLANAKWGSLSLWIAESSFSPSKIVFLLCDLLSVTRINFIASMRIYLTILRCLPSLKASFMHRLLINKLYLELNLLGWLSLNK